MHLHFEKTVNARSDCSILSLTWMGKVPDELPEDEGWKLNRTNYYQEGWLATGNIRGIVGVTFTTSHCKRNVDFPSRTNYNLRGHRSEVILVKWNEPYQKLASCDSSGIIFVWIKYEGRWSIELINDRNTPVTHFSWSHDGRMALICYQDGFVLVGSVAGQRYWSSMLNLEATITCGIWTPDDQQVYFGTNTGQIIVMDVHGAMVSQVQLTADVGIASMAWSCEKFKMEEGDDQTSTDQTSSTTSTSEKKFVLAVGLRNGYIYLLKTFDDVSPVQVDTRMRGPVCMEWSNSRELLAVAGVSEDDDDDNNNVLLNRLKFYNERGVLLYVVTIPTGQGGGGGGGGGDGPVTAMTWGHNDKRLFVATGTQIHIAWISRRIATLQLLCRLQIHGSIRSDAHVSKLPLPPRIRNLIGNLFAQTIRCCVPGPSALREFVSRPPPPNGSIRLHCTMIRHDEDSTSASAGTCYTLYLEYLGGLVPLLKGKRTSKIRPEFVIFDPQMDEDEDLLVVFDASCSTAPPPQLSPPASPAPTQQQQSSSSATFLRWSPDSKSSGSSSQSTSGGNLASDSSDSDRDEGGGGCAASPRMQRRRKRRNKYQRLPSEKQSGGGGGGGGGRSSSGDAGDLEDLAYVDTLPEHVRLVEVTSNIWGTKFKIHGLVNSVPANLGQVTYKTSLLHLQPRQMTLVMTELRDDFPVGPDPNFNPNLFSEDEEDLIQLEEKARIRRTSSVIDNSPPIAPMSPLNGRFARSSAIATTTATTATATMITTDHHPLSKSLIPALAKAESYEDEFPYVELTRTSAINNNHPSTATTSTTTTSFVGVGSQRHAISPLYCDGSVVPTLQSPKNAVAPSDIIFERPPAQTLISDYQNGVQSMKTSFLNDYNHHHHNHHHHHLHQHHHLHHHLRNSSSSSSTSSAHPSDTTISKSSARRKDKQKPLVEEEAAAGPSTNATRPMLIGDSMVRSCSVGYLDTVDEAHPTVSNEVALLILRKDVPKRLVLLNRKKQQQQPQHQHNSNDHQQQHQRKQQQQQRRYQSNTKPLDLKTCGKSKSLDSSDIFPGSSERTQRTVEEHIIHPPTSPSATPGTSTNTVTADATIITTAPITTTTTTKKESKLSFFVSRSPLMRRKKSTQNAEEEDGKQKCRSRSKEKSKCKKNGYEGGGGLSLHTHALVTLENLLTRLREDSGKPANSASSSDTSPRLPRSSPASPAPCKKGKRPQSASPIRKHILSSPLLGGRRFKKNRLLESSDDEVTDTGGSGGDDVCNGTNYRNLETFQKAQLRQKLKRGNGNGNQCVTVAVTTSSSSSSNSSSSSSSSSTSSTFTSTSSSTTATMVQQQQQSQRREFVMHNKAPMWNENSQVYQLDFGGRVTQESAKNFQIEFKGGKLASSNNKSTEIVMQFGRIDGNAYTLDFQYPFSALQAFAVALANVTQRLK